MQPFATYLWRPEPVKLFYFIRSIYTYWDLLPFTFIVTNNCTGPAIGTPRGRMQVERKPELRFVCTVSGEAPRKLPFIEWSNPRMP